ncbi:cell division cycle- protein [Malassezia vespertilionis]|uniref:Cdc25p n=1 Tax=Malassezia vespertilionis TaxID=2020962 RepID=A0A2N1JDQ4_9BASI|nr:cell division cycle- protein [Malassezia vespertilionis]PKI84678.1 hypothetical protein MVES_001311 [Malassezia vespertilionis]WFD06053.1 cell division cycle- protein [Malassezia vespertilionis]
MEAMGAQPVQVAVQEAMGSASLPRSFFAVALYDFSTDDPNLLAFQQGSVMEILSQLPNGWWDAMVDEHTRGWIPSNYVERVADEEAAVARAATGRATPLLQRVLRPGTSLDAETSADIMAISERTTAEREQPARIQRAIQELGALVQQIHASSAQDARHNIALASFYVETTSNIVREVRAAVDTPGIARVLHASHDVLNAAERTQLVRVQMLAKETTSILSLVVVQMRTLTKKLHAFTCAPLQENAALLTAYTAHGAVAAENAQQLVQVLRAFGQETQDLPPLLRILLSNACAPQSAVPNVEHVWVCYDTLQALQHTLFVALHGRRGSWEDALQGVMAQWESFRTALGEVDSASLGAYASTFFDARRDMDGTAAFVLDTAQRVRDGETSLDALKHAVNLLSPLIERAVHALQCTDAPRDTPESMKTTCSALALPLEDEELGRNIQFNASGTVKAGTLDALLVYLTKHNVYDVQYNTTFLYTFPTFMSPADFVQWLMARFHLAPPEGLTEVQRSQWSLERRAPVQRRVISVLKTWLTSFYTRAYEPFLDTLAHFVTVDAAHDISETTKLLFLDVIAQRRAGIVSPEHPARYGLVPVPILPINLRTPTLLDMDVLEIARQLTLMECQRFATIEYTECLNKTWTVPDNPGGFASMIALHNGIVGWVTELLLSNQRCATRALELQHFIRIAECCRALHNYASLWAIISALNNAAIHRLRRTWGMLDSESLSLFENLNSITLVSRNYAKYRELLSAVCLPCVPFCGVYTKDLTFIEDGNTNRLSADPCLVNFNKRRRLADVIMEIQHFQSVPYYFMHVPGIVTYLDTHMVTAMDEEACFAKSLQLEPRELYVD